MRSKLYTVWWASFVIWLPSGQIADYSRIVVEGTEIACNHTVQKLAKKHGVGYSDIPACRGEKEARYNSIVSSNPLYLPLGIFDRVVYICLPRRGCKDVE